MSIFQANSTPLGLWHQLVQEAESACAKPLKEDVESYLVFLLMRYTDRPGMAKTACAADFLKAAELHPGGKAEALRDVGDKCLLIAGFFPGLATKRHVRVSYFVMLGQAAYEALAKMKGNNMYHLLAEQFVNLMDILQAARGQTNKEPLLQPIQAYDLWADTGSEHALKLLKLQTRTSANVCMTAQFQRMQRS